MNTAHNAREQETSRGMCITRPVDDTRCRELQQQPGPKETIKI